MTLSRRDFLRLGSLTAVTAAASACRVVGQKIDQAELPANLVLTPLSSLVAAEPVVRLLNRGGYGPRPGDTVKAVEMGLAAYLEQQLHPEAIEDKALDLMERHLSLTHMDFTQLIEQDAKDASAELVATTINRALYSHRQLYEAMVAFWSDHFNIYAWKVNMMPALKIMDDREVIRPNALGKFRTLLGASARSPAMLTYLDNVRNRKGSINENYARELLELHTLGVNGGYNQQDIQEVARVLTGWGVRQEGLHKGEMVFDEQQHDFGSKLILGQSFPPNRGAEELDALLDLLVIQPATAHFLASKLVRHFVSDEPPAGLVAEVAQTFQVTAGEIKALLRVIFLSEEFATAPAKFKRPFTYVISALRALHTQIGSGDEIGQWLSQMGQLPFHWPPPDGYPDVAAAWTANLLPRWNFALALTHGRLAGSKPPLEAITAANDAPDSQAIIDLFTHLTLGRPLNNESRTLLTEYVGGSSLSDSRTQERLKDSVAFLLASPDFQWI
jgi:hypothetical protein